MTNTDDSKPNAKVVDFKPKNHLAAEAQLNAFIEWAKETVPKGMPNRVYESIRWEDDSWHQHGFERCAFTSLGSNKTAPIPESVTSLANIPVKPTSAPTRGDNWVRF